MAETTELKEAVKAIIDLGEAVDKALEDGKVSFAEGVSIAIGSAPDVFGIIESVPELKLEFKGLGDAEYKELAEYASGELDIRNDKIEGIAEAGFEFLLAFDKLRKKIKEAKEKVE